MGSPTELPPGWAGLCHPRTGAVRAFDKGESVQQGGFGLEKRLLGLSVVAVKVGEVTDREERLKNLVMDSRPPALKGESCSLPPRNSVSTRMSPHTESPAHRSPVAAPGRRLSERTVCVGAVCVWTQLPGPSADLGGLSV